MQKVESVLVLFGGVSPEHAVSCRSAYTIITGLKRAGVNVSVIGISQKGEWIPYLADIEDIRSEHWVESAKRALRANEAVFSNQEIAQALTSPRNYLKYLAGGKLPDLVYIAMHGLNSEDGVIQGFLELADIPYTGSDVLASALCMDKVYTKLIVEHTDVPQLPYVVVHRMDLQKDCAAVSEKIEAQIDYPLFIKPANGGSSVGTFKARNREELQNSLLAAANYDYKILVEPFYPAREVEVACLGNNNIKVCQPGEIVKSSSVEYYDYETKYVTDQAHLDIPAKLAAQTVAQLQKYAREIYKVLGCEGLSRVDFFVSQDEKEIFFNEINSLPGFTSISLFPLAWQNEGLPLEELLLEICNLALESYEHKKRKIDV